ncbi:MAG: putative Holliday junction resolvase [Marinoscillum sp.]|jgi:putative Holliday junction resolvase
MLKLRVLTSNKRITSKNVFLILFVRMNQSLSLPQEIKRCASRQFLLGHTLNIMARILSIDYGSKRTGLAVTDPLAIIATPLETVPSHTLMDFLKSYFDREAVEAVVLGHPKNTDGTPTNATPLVEATANRFRKLFPTMPLILHDERFTSKMALDSMIMSGSKKKDRRNKGNIDLVSATIILQSYLESKR